MHSRCIWIATDKRASHHKYSPVQALPDKDCSPAWGWRLTDLRDPPGAFLKLTQWPRELAPQMYLLIRLIPRDEAARQGGDLMRIQIIKGTWKTEQSPYQIGHRPSCKKGPRLDRGESGSGRSTLPLNISSVTRSSSAVSIRQAARPFSWTTPSESMWPSFLRTRERFLNSSRNFCSCARRRSTLALEEVEDDKRTPMRAHSGGMSKSSQRMIPGIPASST